MISSILLAAGSSRRLGTPKQLLELEGKPVLQHVVDALGDSQVEEIVVVLGHEAERIRASIELPSNCLTVVNENHAEGQSTSLRLGLETVDRSADAVVIVLGDQPRLQPEMVDTVVGAFRERGAPFVRATFAGRQGHPLLAARSQWDALRNITGDKGARLLLRGSSVVVEEIEMDGTLLDLDTWDDYEILKDQQKTSGVGGVPMQDAAPGHDEAHAHEDSEHTKGAGQRLGR